MYPTTCDAHARGCNAIRTWEMRASFDWHEFKSKGAEQNNKSIEAHPWTFDDPLDLPFSAPAPPETENFRESSVQRSARSVQGQHVQGLWNFLRPEQGDAGGFFFWLKAFELYIYIVIYIYIYIYIYYTYYTLKVSPKKLNSVTNSSQVLLGSVARVEEMLSTRDYWLTIPLREGLPAF